MNRMRPFILTLFVLIGTGLLAQGVDSTKVKKNDVYIAPGIVNNRFLNYIFIPDSNTHASLFNLRWQYMYLPQTFPFRRGGMDMTIGLNLGRLFTRKFILGVFVDTRLFLSGRTKQYFSQGFVNDFNASYQTRYSSANDSLRAHVFHDGINNQNGVYLQGNFPSFYGISFSPFPDKWGRVFAGSKKRWCHL
ncbi:MAG: hypothetical protein ACHQRM_04250 [Bacteroidia bacterium]